MGPLAISLLVFAVVVAATAAGIGLNRVLPDHHLSKDSKEVILLGIGVMVTLTALVLGLLVASAKTSFDTKSDEIRHSSVKLILVDHELRQMGPPAAAAREALRRWIDNNASTILSPGGRTVSVEQSNAEWQAFREQIRKLSPADEAQKALMAKVADAVDDLAETRWLLTEQEAGSIQTPFLVVVVLWLAIIYASFGLFSPRNWTVRAVIGLSAFSLSTAVFLILELDQPLSGMLHISDAPLKLLLQEIRR